MPRLSAIVITKNEAANIGACLDSLSFCDERIVVDCGSDDDTVAIAQQKGARVEHNPWAGFGAQKNHALSLAQGDWVLSIDADETVSPDLASAITATIADQKAEAYSFPRLSTFCGRPIRHSGWYPDFVTRLFRKGSARFSDDLVHERLIVQGRVARLKVPLDHRPVERIEQALRRMDQYSTLAAQAIVSRGQRVYFFSGIVRGFWTFFRFFVLRAGFLDGREGFLLAVASAEGTYYKYMKAWLLSRGLR